MSLETNINNLVSYNMKKILEFIEWNFLPAIMCMAIVISFKAPAQPITASDIVIGVLLGYYSGLVVFKFKSKG
jgi:hypothetical protein